jgi:hypothetical protein
MMRINGSMAAALFVASIGVGQASDSPTPPPTTELMPGMEGKCWDDTAKRVRDRTVSGAGSMGTGGIEREGGVVTDSPEKKAAAVPQMDGDRPPYARTIPAC